jgi:hypothetical protein
VRLGFATAAAVSTGVRIGGGRKASGAVAGRRRRGVWGVAEPPDMAPEIHRRRKRRRRRTRGREVSADSCVACARGEFFRVRAGNFARATSACVSLACLENHRNAPAVL